MALTLKEFRELCRTTKPQIVDPDTGEHSDEMRIVGGELVNEDQYFDQLSDLVEKHPPGRPHR